jgi:polysaccharide biosynthesis/export protein
MQPFLKRHALASIVCSAGLLAGCADTIPQDGPDGSRVVTRASTTTTAQKPQTDLPYSLVQIDTSKLLQLRATEARGSLAVSVPPAGRGGTIGVGDVLEISIFEAEAGGLFTASPSESRLGNAVTLPSQEVDREGFVSVPYVGRVEAAGKTSAALAALITAKLKARALEPQVVVGFAARRSGEVNVLGDVYNAAHFSLDSGGERLLGALARAGGPRSPDYETRLTLERDGTASEVRLSDITSNPADNIDISPGDTIYVSHRPDYFIALGATGPSVNLGPIDRRISFGSAHLSLADALARAGGLQDEKANPREVFVFRYEEPETLRAMRVPGLHAGRSPVVYALDLRDPTGLFYASEFQVHAEDIIYASNAGAADITKVENLLMPLIETGVTAAVVR